jgi:uncharacterized protein with HEPN domain
MSDRSPRLLLEDIIEAANKIFAFVEGMTLEDFSKDEKTKDAVIRNFEVIGEAANRLPDEFKLKYHKIEWARIKGFRNRVVHDYFGIDLKIVWTIIEVYLPSAVNEIETALAETIENERSK